MASVDYKKCKAGTGAAGALLRHCDAQERLQHDHSNEHIDKSLTPGNRQGARSYRQTMAALRDRLAELDAVPGANRRKDRVECFMLEVPIPAGHDPQRFAEMAVREISDLYGERNVLNWYLHTDEIHQYMDHGEIKTSLAHIHVPVVPEVDGRLNGKAFSARARMIELNKRIDERAREMGGPAFLTGEHPRQRSVEELKQASYREATEAAERADQRRITNEQAAERAGRRRVANEQAADKAEERASELEKQVKTGKAYLATMEGQIEPLERLLERIRNAGLLSKRKVHKGIFRRGERIYITPEEAQALDASVAVKTPLIEAEAQARQIIDNANRDAQEIRREAARDAGRKDLDLRQAQSQLSAIQRDHPDWFDGHGVYRDRKRQRQHPEHDKGPGRST